MLMETSALNITGACIKFDKWNAINLQILHKNIQTQRKEVLLKQLLSTSKHHRETKQKN